MSPLDLHVLSTPPAFVLSQDQTLSFNPVYISPGFHPARINSFGITVISLRYSVCIVFKVQCSPAVSRASQLVYLITFPKESQHVFLTFFSFLAFFLDLRTFAQNDPPAFCFWAGRSTVQLPKNVRGFGASISATFSPCSLDNFQFSRYNAYRCSHRS